MLDIRYQALILISFIVLSGTAYSVLQETYLDTSNPLLAHLPHHLSKTHYFASKSNPLNVYFIKKSWGWTSAVFLFSFLTSPPPIRARQRLVKYFALTGVWLLFASWFFGPSLMERFLVYSGAECVYNTPTGEVAMVPMEVCYSRTLIAPNTHPHLFSASFVAPATGFSVVPRMKRGHDISGHLFLLTMAILFLTDQLRASFSVRARWSPLHTWAVAANIALLCVWFLGCYTTSVYFHAPLEKLTGFLLGVSSFAMTQFVLTKVLPKDAQSQPQPQPQPQPQRSRD